MFTNIKSDLVKKAFAILLFCFTFAIAGLMNVNTSYGADGDPVEITEEGYLTKFWKSGSTYTCKSSTANWNEFKRLCNAGVSRQEGRYLVFYESASAGSSTSTRYKTIGWNVNTSKSTSKYTCRYTQRYENSELII